MRIGLDFDRVLFDTDAFDKYYKNGTGLHHVDTDVYDENGNYDPEKHADACDIDPEQIWSVLNNLEKFLYSDVELLEKLEEHTLIIVTRGNQRFQKEKVDASGIRNYVDNVVIVEKGSKSTADIDILVDDRKEEIERSNTDGILLKRPEDDLKKVVEKVKEFEA